MDFSYDVNQQSNQDLTFQKDSYDDKPIEYGKNDYIARQLTQQPSLPLISVSSDQTLRLAAQLKKPGMSESQLMQQIQLLDHNGSGTSEGGVQQFQFGQKLNFEEVNMSYRAAPEPIAKFQTQINLPDEEDRQVTKEQSEKNLFKLQPTDQFIDSLRAKIASRIPHVSVDENSRTNMMFELRNENTSSCKMVSGCQCSICLKTIYEVSQEQMRDKTPHIKDDEEAFQQFFSSQLKDDGMFYTQFYDESKVAWRKNFKLPNDYLIAQEKLKGQFHFEKKDFKWLLQNLLSDNDRVLGCEVQLPETCVMEGGLPRLYVRTDKNGCICQVIRHKQTLMSMQQYFGKLITERRKYNAHQVAQMAAEENFIKEQEARAAREQELAGKMKSKAERDVSLEDKRLSQMTDEGSINEKSKSEERVPSRQPPKHVTINQREHHQGGGLTQFKQTKVAKGLVDTQDFKPTFHKDIVILRYYSGETRVLGLQQFNGEFSKYRETNPYWHTIQTVQLAPNNRIGIGKFFEFTFSPIFFDQTIDQNVLKGKLPNLLDFLPEVKQTVYEKMKARVQFDYQQYNVFDEKHLMKFNPGAYCLKQCNKIGYYLQLLRRKEIVRMKVIFYQDETGFIQFYNASDIWVRRDLYKEATEVVPKPVDIGQILNFMKDAEQLDQLKFIQFKHMLDQVTRELVHWKNLNSSIDDVKQSPLFVFMEDLNNRVKALNNMNKNQVLEELEKNESRASQNAKSWGRLSRQVTKSQKLIANASKSQTKWTRTESELMGNSVQQGFNNNVDKTPPAGNLKKIQQQPLKSTEGMYKIGLLGKPEFITENATNAEAYKTKVLDMQPKPIAIQKQPKQNMLDWLRSQKGKHNFLVPLEGHKLTSDERIIESIIEKESKATPHRLKTITEAPSTKRDIGKQTGEYSNDNDDYGGKINNKLKSIQQLNSQSQGDFKDLHIQDQITFDSMTQDANFNASLVQESGLSVKKMIPVQGEQVLIYPSNNAKMKQTSVIKQQIQIAKNLSRERASTRPKQTTNKTQSSLQISRNGQEGSVHLIKGVHTPSKLNMDYYNSSKYLKKQDQVPLKSALNMNQKQHNHLEMYGAELNSKRSDQLTASFSRHSSLPQHLKEQESEKHATNEFVFKRSSISNDGNFMSQHSKVEAEFRLDSGPGLFRSTNETEKRMLTLENPLVTSEPAVKFAESVEQHPGTSSPRGKAQRQIQKKNTVHQLKIIQSKIQKSKMAMISQFIPYNTGQKQDEEAKPKKFKGWKGLGSDSEESSQEDGVEKEEQSCLVMKQRLEPKNEDDPSRNVFLSKVKVDKTKFEFENNPMMEFKMRNITEMGMFDNIQQNMFGAGCNTASTVEQRKVLPITKLKLIENIQRAVKQETLDDISFRGVENTNSKRTGTTNQVHQFEGSARNDFSSQHFTERDSKRSQDFKLGSRANSNAISIKNAVITDLGGSVKNLRLRHKQQGFKQQTVFQSYQSKMEQLSQQILPPLKNITNNFNTRNEPFNQKSNTNNINILETQQTKTFSNQVQKAPQSLAMSVNNQQPSVFGPDFTNNDLYFYPQYLGKQRSEERLDQIFYMGPKIMKKEYGLFKSLELKEALKNDNPTGVEINKDSLTEIAEQDYHQTVETKNSEQRIIITK